jgi:hypothetical protein
MKLHIYEVEWNDSAASGGWHKAQSYLALPPVKCRTAGYLLENSKRRVLIVQSQNTEGFVSDGMNIPKSAVTKIKRLK